ncbi:MAG: gamma-glutamyltransferase [Rhodospirillaceae bacterium]
MPWTSVSRAIKATAQIRREVEPQHVNFCDKAMAYFRSFIRTRQGAVDTGLKLTKDYVLTKAGRRPLRQVLTAAGLAVTLAGCANDGSIEVGSDFFGAIAADEPRAALVGREVLATGGSATDAAVATFFSLAVTLPSSAGLWSAGSCVVFDPASKRFERLDFQAQAGAANRGSGRTVLTLPKAPAAMNALHARYGRLPIQNVLAKSEQLARWGKRVSRQLARDLSVHQSTLGPIARRLLLPKGQHLPLSALLQQPALANTLGRLRDRGIDDLYQGALAADLVAAAEGAGLHLDGDLLRQAAPKWMTVTGLAHDYQAWTVVAPNSFADQRLNTVLARLLSDQGWHGRGDDGRLKALHAAHLDADIGAGVTAASGQDRAGSTAFWALDADGQAVGCAISLGAAFGSGELLADTGLFTMLIDAADGQTVDAAVLLVGNTLNWQTHMIAAASGGPAAGDALLAVSVDHFDGEVPLPVAISRPRQAVISARQVARETAIETIDLPENLATYKWARLARVRVMHCFDGIPRAQPECVVGDDRRGAGLATFDQ